MGESERELTDLEIQTLLDHRKRLDDLRAHNITAFDQALLMLSAGAIGLSLVLLQWLSESGKPKAMWCLVISWVALVSSVLFNLASYHTGAYDLSAEIRKIDADISVGRRINEDGNLFRTATNVLNLVCLVAFFLGALFLFIFAFKNASGG